MRQRKRLLLVAFHFPPLQGSSGVHRAVAFGRYLPQFGWDVTVLSAHPRAYSEVEPANLRLVPDSLTVIRAQAFDAARHFAVGGRYPGALARPDRWLTWVPFAVRQAIREFRRRPFDAVLSTFPVASTHLIGDAVRRRCGIPWLAEFRDPMATSTYPFDAKLRRIWKRIQDNAVAQSARIIVTTPGAARCYRKMYPAVPSGHIVVIPNGFEPHLLPTAPDSGTARGARGPLTLLHSGMLYPRERDPEPFLRALRELRRRGVAGADRLQVRLRASGFEDRYAAMIADLGLQEVVTLSPSLSYADALAEMCAADALLIFQARVCNDQIPAKLYEYLYAGRPIIALTDPTGDTGRLLHELGVPGVAALENEADIAAMLAAQLPRIRGGDYPVPAREQVMGLSRESGACELARQLDDVVRDS